MSQVVAELSAQRPELNAGALLARFLSRKRIPVRRRRRNRQSIADMLGERLLERRRRFVRRVLCERRRRQRDVRNCDETGEICNRPYENHPKKLPKHCDLVLRQLNNGNESATGRSRAAAWSRAATAATSCSRRSAC